MSTKPLLTIPVGIVVERRKAKSQWVDFVWRPVAALPGVPDTQPWSVLDGDEAVTRFYAGAAEIELFRSDTGQYRDNLMSGAPGLWVVMRASGGEPPYRIFTVTADPSEGEAFTETGTDLVEMVPMPDAIRDAVANVVAAHHVEQTFEKRQREPADPEAMARRRVTDTKP